MGRSKVTRKSRPKPDPTSHTKRQTRSQASTSQRSQPAPSPTPRDAITASKVTKQARMIAMLHQDPGVSIASIATAIGWQKHSVRGFFAAIVKKRFGFDLAWRKSEAGERLYRIEILSSRRPKEAGDRVA
jgi:hypothetical protein